jgi:PhoPQ-activated pathogenicity-related protein
MIRALALSVATAAVAATSAQADLFEYVRKADPSYSWKFVRSETNDFGTIHYIDLTSQTWQGIVWTHQLTIHEPKTITYPDAVLLFVSGGSMDRKAKPDALALQLANDTGARVALLPQVPNQPLLGDRKEDDLITETFVRYLETKDENWPLLFPMAKSAVKAMDAVQAFAREKGWEANRFVVSGASKRGWTTWLSGIVDDRVVAIAPIVIPTLNFNKQLPHQLEVYGQYSEQIEDYVRRGLLKNIESPEKTKLWKMVDPYSYLDRLAKKPSLQVNGTNDRYWALDSMNLYWDDIQGPKYVVLVPNAGHGIEVNRDYATHGIASLFRHAISGRPMPTITVKPIDGDKIGVEVMSEPAPKKVALQVATSKTRDFRDSKWTATEGQAGATTRLTTLKPDGGSIALFADLTYEVDGMEYHLSTPIRVWYTAEAPASRKVAAE